MGVGVPSGLLGEHTGIEQPSLQPLQAEAESADQFLNRVNANPWKKRELRTVGLPRGKSMPVSKSCKLLILFNICICYLSN